MIKILQKMAIGAAAATLMSAAAVAQVNLTFHTAGSGTPVALTATALVENAAERGIANIQLSGISEGAAEESLELAQVAYGSGAVTVVELLDAQTNYLSAQQAQLMEKNHLGFVSDGHLDDPKRQDELYDRE